MNRKIVAWTVAVGISQIIFGCQPKPNLDDLVRDMVVQTGYDNTVNFSSYATYAMQLDTIGQIFNADPLDTIITGEYAQMVSHEVKNILDKAGYKQVTPKQNPDLGVAIFIIRDYSQTTSVVYPTIGYSSYYYPPSYGYGSYPYVQTYSTDAATLVLDLVDMKQKNSQNQVKVIWTANIGDVISSPDPYQKSIEAIDQAFTQSPYIRK